MLPDLSHVQDIAIALLQLKEILCLLVLSWLVYWTYRHFIPNILDRFLRLIEKFHDDGEDDDCKGPPVKAVE